jgi:hypothetical protein
MRHAAFLPEENVMFRHAIVVPGSRPAAPASAVLAGRIARVLLAYARARRKRQTVLHAVRRREFGTVCIDGQRFGAIYEDDELIAVIADVDRL